MTLGSGRRCILLAAALLGSSLALAACSSIVPGSGPPPRLFTLSPKTTFDEPNLPKASFQLVVAEPTAPASLDTVRIAVRRTPLELEYFAKTAWTDRVPGMLQTLLVSSFENSGKIMAVGRDSIGLRADYAVQLDLRHFEATYQDGKPRAHVEINAKLIRMPQRDIVGYTDCNYLTDAEGDTIEHVVEAFNESLGRCMKRIVEYTLTTAKPPPQQP